MKVETKEAAAPGPPNGGAPSCEPKSWEKRWGAQGEDPICASVEICSHPLCGTVGHIPQIESIFDFKRAPKITAHLRAPKVLKRHCSVMVLFLFRRNFSSNCTTLYCNTEIHEMLDVFTCTHRCNIFKCFIAFVISRLNVIRINGVYFILIVVHVFSRLSLIFKWIWNDLHLEFIRIVEILFSFVFRCFSVLFVHFCWHWITSWIKLNFYFHQNWIELIFPVVFKSHEKVEDLDTW